MQLWHWALRRISATLVPVRFTHDTTTDSSRRRSFEGRSVAIPAMRDILVLCISLHIPARLQIFSIIIKICLLRVGRLSRSLADR